MPTFRKNLKQSLTLMLVIATFSAYSPVFAETTESSAQSNVWSGVYQGFTPCEDCKGVKTTLALNKNNSYILISQYVGKSEKEIVEKGKFAEGNESNTLMFTPRNSSQVRYYAVGDNTLTQLDENANRIIGKLAERYVLRKNEIRQPQNQGSHH